MVLQLLKIPLNIGHIKYYGNIKIYLYNIEMTKPKHYKLKIDPREYITKNKLDFNEGNIIKYVTRYKSKNGLEDLLKAKDYLEYIIKNYK